MTFMMCKYHPDNQAIYLLWNNSMLQFACEECTENEKKQENRQILKLLSIRKALKEPDYFIREFNLNKENKQIIGKIDNINVQELNKLINTIDSCVKDLQISLSDLINQLKEIVFKIIERKEKLRNNLEKISYYAQFKEVFKCLDNQKCLTDDVVNQIQDNIQQIFLEIEKNQNSFNQEILEQLLIPKNNKLSITPQYQIFKNKLENLKNSIAPLPLLLQNTRDQNQDPNSYQRNLKFSNNYKQSEIVLSLNEKVAYAEQDIWQVVVCDQNQDPNSYQRNLKFSNNYKQSGIVLSLNEKVAYAEQDIWQVVVCEQQIPENRKISFYFKILQIHQFYSGICFRNRIDKGYRGYVSSIGHGYYLMCRYGHVYSHHDQDINGQQKGFQSFQGDVIEISVDMIEKTITWTNNRSNSFKLTIQTIDPLYPCLRLAKSKVQITER
ncbi:unnamed protein product [Paramecium sonneborni]|uniref:SPRY domain-containing protein n=1 Tax=Paramecium sonneborni TaxID=65129 RepID=A0A8S1PX20_9CILI|nr:unnamed protein product [Paramecium sonneborni]